MAKGDGDAEFNTVLTNLRANPQALRWPERRELAKRLTAVVADQSPSSSILALMELLATDHQPQVRREIAEGIGHLEGEAFARIAALLSSDSSFFVRNALERAMARKRKGAKATQRLSKNLVLRHN